MFAVKNRTSITFQRNGQVVMITSLESGSTSAGITINGSYTVVTLSNSHKIHIVNFNAGDTFYVEYNASSVSCFVLYFN